MNLETIEYNLHKGTAFLGINRPKAMNALNKQVLTELGQAIEACQSNEDVKSICIFGVGGKAFVAGADIKEFKDFKFDESFELSQFGQKVFSSIENSKKPVVAKVDGFALGGGFELALSCDFIICSEKSKFGLPEVGLGLIPGYGGTQRLARCIGLQKAKRIVFTGDMVRAEQALQWGIVAEVVSVDELDEFTNKILKSINGKSPSGLRLAKECIHTGFDQTLSEGLALESNKFADSFETEDKVEGIAAFLEKRAPNFTGV